MATIIFYLTLTPGDETWTLIGPLLSRPSREVPNPLANRSLYGLVASLREWASQPVPLDRPDSLGTAAFVQGLAHRVSDRLTQALLTEDDRRALVAALDGNGRVRLVIRVRPAAGGWNQTADAALALPWELLAPESGVYPVRDGRLAVIREAVTDQAPDLPEPSGPLTLAVTIAAPEDRAGFPYEQESFRLLAALTPLGQRAVFSNLGGLNDLVELVADVRATAIHFRGHGLPGSLLFENALGFADEVPVAELQRRLATVLLSPRRAGTFPGLFFLAAPYTAREVAPAGQEPASSAYDEESSAAAALHRGGFSQVIGFFGPVNADLNTRLEERFYGALAEGRSALVAVEEARTALLEPVGEAGEPVHYPFGWSQLAVYHRGPDLPLARHGQGEVPSLIHRRIVEVSGLPVLEHGFIGRRGMQHEVRRKVERQGQRLVVIQGLGGLGKTALASQLLVRAFAPEPADQLVLRCRELMETDGDPVLELRAQAEEHGRLHGLPFWDERVKELRERVPEQAAGLAVVLRRLRQERPGLVLYIDNAETLQSGPATEDPAALGSWRPGLEAWWEEMERLADEDGCLMMVTTRYAWEGLSPRAFVALPPMGPADSLRLIDSFETLGDLPLDVRVRLAERVNGHPRTVEFLDRLIAQRREEIRKVTDAWTDLIAPILPAQEVKIRVDLLIEKLWDKLSEGAKEHARALTVLRRPAPQFVIDRMGGVRDELIRAGWLTRYREQVRTGAGIRWSERWGLQALPKGFVTAIRAGDLQKDHRMAAKAWEAWLDSSGTQNDDAAEAIHHLQILGEGDRAWPIVHRYTASLRDRGQFREARDILRQCEGSGTTGDRLAQALRLLAQMGMSLGEHGPELANLLNRAFVLAESKRTQALVVHETGVLLFDQGDLKNAESVLRHALDLADQLPDFPIVERIAWEEPLATVVERNGRLSEAEQIFRRSLAAQEHAGMPGDTIQVALIRFSLGRVLVMQMQYSEAETLLRAALTGVGRLLGEEHPSSTATLHFLGKALEGQGKYLEAEDLLRRASSSIESQSSQQLHNMALNDHGLAQVLLAQGRVSEAETLLRRALALKQKAYGHEHLETLATKQTLAVALDLQDKLHEAERLLREVLASFEKLAGPNNPESAGILQALGSVLLKKGQTEEAESVHRKGLSLVETSRGTLHPECSVHLHSLASVLTAQERYQEAEELLRRALSINEGSLPPSHPILGHLFHGLARALEGQGQLAEAESLFRRSLAITEDVDKDHPEVFPSLINLADIVLQQNRIEEAESLLRRALQIAFQSFGPASGPAGAALARLAFLEARLGRRESSATARRALEALAASPNRDARIERDLQAIAQAG